MKINLLILALVTLSQAIFRHLSNFSLESASPPLIKSLTANELAVQYESKVITINISNQAIMQTLALSPQFPIQLLPSQSLMLYINQSTIYQAYPAIPDYNLLFTVKEE